ncbi:zinc finger protein 768-like isoform X2 [Pollicipes pollicipes]|uniref:zinc finger protein 768-like isoform X2 n=1 Tax=Pollicipes pollicipes TaxID=41117 RepID=UPI0018854F39|nr:zinc finger protein 768-like isoform X2 [Pollicipes pollicipes]
MASGQMPPVGRGQCCMLCYSPLYGTGLSIYHSRTYHAEKSLYAKLMEVTNYTASIPQLVSDMMCSICYTMISQADQLDSQLNHVTAHIRALFHKMVQIQTEAVRLNRAAQAGQDAPAAPPRTGSNGAGLHLPGPPGPGPGPGDKTTRPPEQTTPTNLQLFKKPAKESEAPQRAAWPSSSSESGDGAALQPTTAASPAPEPGDEGLFNIGAFLQTDLREVGGEPAPRAPAPNVAQTGDFTDKFVQGMESDDAYRYQCVLCNKLGDCEEAIRRHVRTDHPGADRISFPAPPPPAKRSRASAGAAKPAKMARSITATAPAMAQKIAERAYVCVSCDKAFGCEAFLTRHVEAQKCGQMFSCQYCAKEFTRSDKKVRHERSHTGERPFSCEFCGKTFSRRDKCTKHERTHTRCRPFECHSCREVMGTAAEYTAHRRHCGDRASSAAAAAAAAGRAWPPQQAAADA